MFVFDDNEIEIVIATYIDLLKNLSSCRRKKVKILYRKVCG